MSDACPECLRRGHLLGHLSPEIGHALDGDRRALPPALLALEDADLIQAVARRGAAPRARRFSEGFEAGAALAALRERGVDAVCRHAAAYPSRLSDLVDAPAVLFVAPSRERLGVLDNPCVALVGSRRASPYALDVAHELGRGLAAAGVPVVSGLALGVDAAAHRGALAANGAPVGVLGGGPDVVYPRRHAALFAQVREHGLLVSELPPGHPAMRWSFPARNRIMAALAGVCVVVEAGEPSGSLITATHAAELGRGVGAVPGLVTSRRAAGGNRLLRDGAAVIRDTRDVLEELFGPDADAGCAQTLIADERMLDEELEPELAAVLDAVEAGHPAAQIATLTALPPGRVRAALGRLERLGLVRRDAFGQVCRSAAP